MLMCGKALNPQNPSGIVIVSEAKNLGLIFHQRQVTIR
jgi:hypothetical protein